MKQLHFKTNVQIKSIIGKDLINDDNIAILELVKNSFDADAKRVDISFCNLKHNDDSHIEQYSDKTSRLIIQDDGIGMNSIDLQEKWLNIAYSEKKTNSRQFNRMMAGAKGVGRFSCDRLGKYLNLYSKKSGDEYVVLKIDWEKLDYDDVIIDDKTLKKFKREALRHFESLDNSLKLKRKPKKLKIKKNTLRSKIYTSLVGE